MTVLRVDSNKPSVWLCLLIISTLLELTALYYQYALDYAPCVVCIHVRLWLAVIWLLSITGLALPKTKPIYIVLLISVLFCFLALIERSWQLLGTERGFIMGSCNFDTGLPNWFAVDKWLPYLFKVETTCGYTPTIAAGITMAEILLVLFSALALYTLGLLFFTFKKPKLIRN